MPELAFAAIWSSSKGLQISKTQVITCVYSVTSSNGGFVGLDAVVVLELGDEGVAVKRALGRRVDPQTGRVYHLDFDPPPAKEPGLAARLKV